MPPRLLLLGHPACLRHETGPDHAETPARLIALRSAFDADGALRAEVEQRTGTPATERDLLRVHGPEHVARVRDAAEAARRAGGLVWLDDDTPVSAGSWEAALASAGCAIGAAQAVAAGEVPTAFALGRPPGHHATGDRAMGFCLFNNVAVAVRRLQAEGRARRVLVVDFDAHHANGTQDIFYEDPSVYLLSLHLDPDYPGTGGAEERGAGGGLGTTLNVPLPHGTSAAEYRRAWRQALALALADFTPDLAVISAGFDGMAGDPEGGFLLEPEDLHGLVTDLLERLPPALRGRAVAVLEGGYALERIGAGFTAVLRALAGMPAAGT